MPKLTAFVRCACERPLCGFTAAVQYFEKALLLGPNATDAWVFYHNLGIALQAEHAWYLKA